MTQGRTKRKNWPLPIFPIFGLCLCVSNLNRQQITIHQLFCFASPTYKWQDSLSGHYQTTLKQLKKQDVILEIQSENKYYTTITTKFSPEEDKKKYSNSILFGPRLVRSGSWTKIEQCSLSLLLPRIEPVPPHKMFYSEKNGSIVLQEEGKKKKKKIRGIPMLSRRRLNVDRWAKGRWEHFLRKNSKKNKQTRRR